VRIWLLKLCFQGSFQSVSVSSSRISDARNTMMTDVVCVAFCFFFPLSYSIFMLELEEEKSNQPLKFVILKISSQLSLLQFFFKFRTLYEIKGFFQFHPCFLCCNFF